MCSWYKFLENVISDFKDEGDNFNDIAEMNNITVADKLDMSYEIYIKDIMHAVEWKPNAMINKYKKVDK